MTLLSIDPSDCFEWVPWHARVTVVHPDFHETDNSTVITGNNVPGNSQDIYRLACMKGHEWVVGRLLEVEEMETNRNSPQFESSPAYVEEIINKNSNFLYSGVILQEVADVSAVDSCCQIECRFTFSGLAVCVDSLDSEQSLHPFLVSPLTSHVQRRDANELRETRCFPRQVDVHPRALKQRHNGTHPAPHACPDQRAPLVHIHVGSRHQHPHQCVVAVPSREAQWRLTTHGGCDVRVDPGVARCTDAEELPQERLVKMIILISLPAEFAEKIPSDQPFYRQLCNNKSLAILMPHCGITLSSFLSSHSNFAQNLFVQGLKAILHIESHFVVHRDIKGDNILVDPETGKLTLIDFDRVQPKHWHSRICKNVCWMLMHAASAGNVRFSAVRSQFHYAGFSLVTMPVSPHAMMSQEISD
ncbi:hypothetical protein Pelo_9871 [Pelomyxa schiedti]|nr:hypothetical protein Pelo_9871 [Pelomyxa schiedti]